MLWMKYYIYYVYSCAQSRAKICEVDVDKLIVNIPIIKNIVISKSEHILKVNSTGWLYDW